MIRLVDQQAGHDPSQVDLAKYVKLLDKFGEVIEDLKKEREITYGVDKKLVDSSGKQIEKDDSDQTSPFSMDT